MTENSFEKVVSALATVQPIAHTEDILISVELERKPHPKLLNGPLIETGREVLVIRVPYSRSRTFLTTQLERAREQQMQLEETMKLAAQEVADLEQELRLLDAPKTAL